MSGLLLSTSAAGAGHSAQYAWVPLGRARAAQPGLESRGARDLGRPAPLDRSVPGQPSGGGGLPAAGACSVQAGTQAVHRAAAQGTAPLRLSSLPQHAAAWADWAMDTQVQASAVSMAPSRLAPGLAVPDQAGLAACAGWLQAQLPMQLPESAAHALLLSCGSVWAVRARVHPGLPPQQAAAMPPAWAGLASWWCAGARHAAR